MLDRIALITGNAGKAAEYAAMLGIEVTPAKAELTEVQSLDVAHVAACKAADAYAQLREPVLVDDTGLTIHAWNGLPGALDLSGGAPKPADPVAGRRQSDKLQSQHRVSSCLAKNSIIFRSPCSADFFST